MTTLIIPSVSPAASLEPLLRRRPLPLLPVAGRELVGYQLDLAASLGFEHVLLLVTDRPEEVRGFVGSGQAWGLGAEVAPVPAGLPVLEQLRRVARADLEAWVLHPQVLVPPVATRERRELPATDWRDAVGWVLVHIGAGTWTASGDPEPAGSAEPPGHSWRVDSVSAYHRACMELVADPRGAVIPGFEVAPGIVVSRGSRFSLGAVIEPPVLVAPRARVSHRANLGPAVVVGEDSLIDDDATLRNTVVMPSTYVGRLLEADGVVLDGQTIVTAVDGTVAVIGDDLLLAELDRPAAGGRLAWWASRAAGVALMAPLLPLLGLSLVVARSPRIVRRRCLSHRVRYSVDGGVERLESAFTELRSDRPAPRWLGQLLDVAAGRLALVGNPPLDVEAAANLEPVLVERWLERPAGMFGLAQANALRGQADPSLDETAAAAATFSGQRGFAAGLRMVAVCLGRLLSLSAWRRR